MDWKRKREVGWKRKTCSMSPKLSLLLLLSLSFPIQGPGRGAVEMCEWVVGTLIHLLSDASISVSLMHGPWGGHHPWNVILHLLFAYIRPKFGPMMKKKESWTLLVRVRTNNEKEKKTLKKQISTFGTFLNSVHLHSKRNSSLPHYYTWPYRWNNVFLLKLTLELNL